MESRQGRCVVCAAPASYVCPRCSQSYCTVPCYKAHGARCVAAFHGQQLSAALRNEKVDPEGQAAMHDLLQRFTDAQRHDADDWAELMEGEEEDHELLVELLRKLDQGSFDATRDVPAHLQQRFARDMRVASEVVPLWEPWWERGPGGSGVDLVYNVAAIPPFSTLTTRDPSPLLPLVALDLLFALVYCARRYNGAHVQEGAALVLQLCVALREAGPPPPSIEHWIAGVTAAATSAPLGAQTGTQTALAFRDTIKVCGHAAHVNRALWELHATLVSQRGVRACEVASKKALFFLSWAIAHRPVMTDWTGPLEHLAP